MMDVCDQVSSLNPDSQQDIVKEDKTEPAPAALQVITRDNCLFDIFYPFFFNLVKDCNTKAK